MPNFFFERTGNLRVIFGFVVHKVEDFLRLSFTLFFYYIKNLFYMPTCSNSLQLKEHIKNRNQNELAL